MSPAHWPADRTLAFCRWLLRRASRSLPWERRADWLNEWEGELWALHRRGEGAPGLLLFAFAAPGDARRARHRGESRMGGFVSDLRHALRRLRRSPVTVTVAVLVLALGIGVNTALFGALEAALLRPLPYPASNRLVVVDMLLQRSSSAPMDTFPWSWPKFAAIQNELRTVPSMAAYAPASATLTGEGQPATRIGIEYVSPGYFELLGVRPVAGRTFAADETPPASVAAVVVGHAFWRTRFGGDPDLVGRRVTMDGADVEVIGVAPPGFRGVSGSADVFLSFGGALAMGAGSRVTSPWRHWIRTIGRLADGATLGQARAEAAAMGAMLTERWPDPAGAGAHGVTLVPLESASVNPVTRLTLSAVSAAGALLLVIAFANVAGLLLVRAAARRPETSVRAALGAGRWRLVREHLIESLLLALAGGLAGIAVARGAQRLVSSAVQHALETSGTRGLQFIDPAAIRVDGPVLFFGLALAVLAGLLAGLVPARDSLHLALGSSLRAGSRSVEGDHSALPARAALVAGQLALTFVLLAGTGLFRASFARLSAVDAGFHRDDVLNAAWIRGSEHDDETNRTFERVFEERLRALPGVHAIALGTCAPLGNACATAGIRRVDDGPLIGYDVMEGILENAVSPSFFETLDIPLIAGRTFDERDVYGGPPVTVISESAARTLFPGGSALGHRIMTTSALTDNDMAEVIGVVADVRYHELEEEPGAAMYISRTQLTSPIGRVFVHTAGDDPLALLDDVRSAAHALDPYLALFDATTMGERRALATARTRTVLWLLGAFAFTGLLLSGVGLYGVVAWSVAQRRREIGLRLALGARPRGVFALVLRAPVLLVTAGTAAGAIGALLLTRLARTLLFGVEPGDPRILGATAAVLLLVALLAACVPARLAMKVEPATTLRGD